MFEKKPVKILLVEDETLIAMSQKIELEEYRYKVTTAFSGEEAIDIFIKDSSFDLILMDITLGKGIDGIETAHRILKNNNVPIVFLSSHIENEIVEKTENISSYGYIMKNSAITVLDAGIKMAYKLFQANRKIEEQKQYLSTTLNSIGDSVITTDVSGIITGINPVAEKLTGWKMDEAVGKPLKQIFNIIDNRTGNTIDNPVKKVVDEDMIAGLSTHTNLVDKKGNNYHISDSAAPIKDSLGNIIGAVLVFRDVTEEYMMQEKINENEIRYRNIFEKSTNGIIIHDIDGNILDVNHKLCKLLDYSKEECCKLNISRIRPGNHEDKQDETEFFEELQKKGFIKFESDCITKNGKKINCEITSTLIDIGNEKIVQEILKDKTVSDKSKKALKESETKFKSITENAMDYIFIKDKERKYTFVNKAMTKLLNLNKNEIIGKIADEIFGPEQGHIINELDDIAFSGGTVNETKDIFIGGKKYYLSTIQTPLKVKDGKVQSVMGIVRDITKLIEAEEDILLTRQRYQSLFDDSPVPLSDADVTEVYKYIDELRKKGVSGFKNYFNENPDEVFFCLGKVLWKNINKAALKLYNAKNFQELINNLSKIFTQNTFNVFKDQIIGMAEGLIEFDTESEILTLDQKIRYTFARMSINRKSDGAVWALIATIDVTDRILAEEALRNSENKMRSIFRAAPTGIGMLKDKILIEVNSRICNMTGYNMDELIGKTTQLLYNSQEEYEMVVKEKHHQIEKNGTGVTEAKWKKKDGTIIDVLMSSTPIDINDFTKGITFTALDITERKNNEEQIKKLLKEKEILLKEVHHRIKNNMNTLRSLLALQAHSIKDSSAKTALDTAKNRMTGMMILYDKLYQSDEIDKISSVDYLSTLVDEIVDIYHVRVNIIKNLDDIMMNITLASPLGIIINELISNSMKYAFQDNARNIIEISLIKKDDKGELIVQDNGVGFNEKEHPGGFGLELVDVLTRQIDGTFNIEQDNGTKCTLKFDL